MSIFSYLLGRFFPASPPSRVLWGSERITHRDWEPARWGDPLPDPRLDTGWVAKREVGSGAAWVEHWLSLLGESCEGEGFPVSGRWESDSCLKISRGRDLFRSLWEEQEGTSGV